MTAKLFEALVAAQSAARAVTKDATNSFHRYAYASSEGVIAEARAALNTSGLALTPAGWDFEANASDAPAEGKARLAGRVRVRYLLVHVSGESLPFESSTPIVIESGRPWDKAESAALTLNLAYFLRGLLLLPRGEEHAVDQRDDRGYEPPTGPGPRKASHADPVATAEQFEKRIAAASTMAELAAVGQDIQRADELSDANVAALKKQYVARKAHLSPAGAAA